MPRPSPLSRPLSPEWLRLSSDGARPMVSWVGVGRLAASLEPRRRRGVALLLRVLDTHAIAVTGTRERVVQLTWDMVRTRLGVDRTTLDLALADATTLELVQPWLSDVATHTMRVGLTPQSEQVPVGAEARVRWSAVVEQLHGVPAALAVVSAVATLTDTPDQPTPIPFDAIVAHAWYTPNAVRDGLARAVERGVLLRYPATHGPTRFALTPLALGQVTPVSAAPSAQPSASTATPSATPGATSSATPPSRAEGVRGALSIDELARWSLALADGTARPFTIDVLPDGTVRLQMHEPR